MGKTIKIPYVDLKSYQGMFHAVFQAAQDAISVVNENGFHIMVNPAYTKLTGIMPDEIIGKNALYDVDGEESLHLQVLSTKKPVENTIKKIRPSGKTVVAQAAPIIVDNELKGSVAILHDLSGIKDLTDKLTDAENKIRELSYKYKPDDIIGDSYNIRKVKDDIAKAAKFPVTVLLRGESGTGKELFANSLHAQSKRHKKNFIRVNCAALSDSLLESELFGYEEGAFTGARKGGKKGLFEEADGGTIFLDEISEISMSTQTKLLRVLQEKEIMRIGSNYPVQIDVRIVAATNADLLKAVKEEKFRQDLYYRLNVYPIYIPALRERKEDIPLLISNFISKKNDEYGRNVTNISDDSLKLLVEYNWPGNVRELENTIARAIINMNFNEQIIKIEHIPLLSGSSNVKKVNAYFYSAINSEEKNVSLNKLIESIESEYIKNIYLKLGKNKVKTAEKLGISIRTLYYKMTKYNISY